MPQFAANLSMMYPELDFLDRFEAAARDGFKAVEYLFPYAWDASELAARLKAHGLQQVLFNAPPGGRDRASIAKAWEDGYKGMACLPGHDEDFDASIDLALQYAQALACPRIHVMAGLVPQGQTRATLREGFVRKLRRAGEKAARVGVEVLMEPINTRNIPGFFLNRQDDAHALVGEIGLANVKVQFDLYHCQIVEGDVAMKIRQYLPTGRVGHFQIAGVPERHEPDVGEMNYPYLFQVIDEVSTQCGWQGWVGCEYLPARGATSHGTSDGLGWLRDWRARA